MIEYNEFGEELCGHGYPIVDGACYDCPSGEDEWDFARR